MKPYTFTLPDDEAEVLDANLALLRYAYPDMSEADALVAIVRIGSDVILQRLRRMERLQHTVRNPQENPK